MTVKCHVHLLDGSEVDFEVGKNAKASVLLDHVLRHLNIVEKDYFGLTYRGSMLQKAWLTPGEKLKGQIKKSDRNLAFDFAVKFYPTDPTTLKEEITRYQICLQIRRDLASHLDSSADWLAPLLSYWLQSEYEGKNDNPKAVKDCIKDFKNPPKEASSAEFTDRVLILYRSRSGMQSSDADRHFLTTAAGLKTYGVHFYKGKDTTGNEIGLGISAKGVVEKRDRLGPAFHPWKRIRSMKYKDKKLKIKLLRAPSGGDPRLKKAFLFDSEKQAKSIWKGAVEHHVFFRVGEKYKEPRPPSEKKPKKGSFLRRFSSRAKRPKTETDAQQDSDGISRRQPKVTKESTLRRSASLRHSTASESSTEQKTPVQTEKGGVTYFVSREPQMDSESSSEEGKVIKTGNSKPPLVPVPLPADETYAQIEDKWPDKKEKAKDEDETSTDVAAKKDGATGGGSSSLLLAETILEEDEQDHVPALPPAKPYRPVQLAPLKDEEHGVSLFSKQRQDSIKKAQQFGSDLDAEAVLSPTSRKNDVSFTQADPTDVISQKRSHTLKSDPSHGPVQNVSTVVKTPKVLFDNSQYRPVSAEKDGESHSPSNNLHIKMESAEEDDEEEDYAPETGKNELLRETEKSASAGNGNVNGLMNQTTLIKNAESEDQPHPPETKIFYPQRESAEILIFDDTDRENQEEDSEENDRKDADVFADEYFKIAQDDHNGAQKDEHYSKGALPAAYHVPPIVPRLNLSKEPTYQTAARSLGVEFGAGDLYKLSTFERCTQNDSDEADVATSAVDAQDVRMEHVNEMIYEEERSAQRKGKYQKTFLTGPRDELDSRNTSFSDITDNTDELLVPDVLEKAWSQGAGLDEDDELFRVLFRTPPIGRKNRSRPDIRPRQETVAFRVYDKDVIRSQCSGNWSKRPFIPSWPFDPISTLNSRSLGDLDREAIRAAARAQRELLDEDRRLSDMEMMEDNDDDISTPDDDFLSQSGGDYRYRDQHSNSAKFYRDPELNDLRDVMSRSRSASPRMVGEEFIPGVPDFVHSVVPHQLKTPCLPQRDSDVPYLKPAPRGIPRKPTDIYLTSATFEDSVTKVSSHARRNEPYFRRCSPKGKPPGYELHSYWTSPTVNAPEKKPRPYPRSLTALARPLPIGRSKSNAGTSSNAVHSNLNTNFEAAETTQPVTSSGRSTPQSKAGAASQSEGTLSSKSKSSAASFPRFIHSVFPLRRSSSSDSRGRSKTRRKREKKVTKQKSKKKATTRNSDRKKATSEVSRSSAKGPYKGFPVLPSSSYYSTLAGRMNLRSSAHGYRSTARSTRENRIANVAESPRWKYDQESLDKIILSESDDAHSKRSTPQTVRKVAGFTAKDSGIPTKRIA